MDRFGATQAAIIDRDNRNMAAQGIAMSQVLNDLQAQIDSGAIGIQADAWDVDAIAAAHATRPLAFAIDADTTIGLTLGHRGGVVMFGQSLVAVAAGTVLLTANAVNYVEVNAAGAVSANTLGWTAGSVPLYQVTTGAAAIALVVNHKALLRGMQDGGVAGKLLSTAAKTKEISIDLGTVNATKVVRLIAPAAAGKVARVSIAVGTTVAANDTNYWSVGLVNKGPAGTGTTAMVNSASAANSTRVTGGSAITAEIKRNLVLAADPDCNHAAEDVLVLTLTKTASAADLVGASVRVDFTSEA